MTDDKPDTKATQETRDLLNEITPQRTSAQKASDAEAEIADVKSADAGVAETAAPPADPQAVSPADGSTS